jgi:glycosyltransferase involved in cell wall biosynthesis
MNIAVNTRLLIKNKLDGIGWFTYENFRRITAAHPEHEFYFLFDRNYSNEFIFSQNVHPIVINPPARHPLLWITWFDYSLPRILEDINADLFVSPDGFLSLNTKVPQLPVIHDLNFLSRPQDLPFTSRIYYRKYFAKFAKKAARIVTVSEYSKQDICSSYNIDPCMVDVVYNGAHELYLPLTPEEIDTVKINFASNCPYFLFVGSLHPRKNIKGLLEAFDIYKSRYKTSHKLIIVGEKMFLTKSFENVYREMQWKEDVIFTGRLSPEEISYVVGSATALVFVSFFEGFGIPIVEAMHADVPVIASNTTSMPEVAGEAALYVDPTNNDEIAEAMYLISSREDIRSQLINKARTQRAKFNWDIAAKKLWESIETVLIKK